MLYLFEFLGVALVLSLLGGNAAFREWFEGLASRIRLLFMAIAILMLAGQFTRSSSATFPFVFWGMYTKEVSVPELHRVEIEGRTKTGERVQINASRLYPSLGFGTLRIQNRLRSFAEDARSEDYHQTELDQALLRAIASTYERQNPQVKLDEVSLVWFTQDFHDLTEESEVVLTVRFGN